VIDGLLYVPVETWLRFGGAFWSLNGTPASRPPYVSRERAASVADLETRQETPC
jgi:hypothetical protein